MLSKASVGQGKRNIGCARLAHPKLVRHNTTSSKENNKVSSKRGKRVNSGSQTVRTQLRKRPNYGLPLLKRFFVKKQYPVMTQNLIMHSWKEGTRKTYRNYIQQWIMYCKYHKIDPHEPSQLYITNFLRLLLEDGASYSTVNVARCALSAVLDTGSGMTIGGDWSVSRVVKGCGNLRPPEPKYDITWDVSKVFRKLESWGGNSDLSLLQLSKKVVMLLLLCTAQRGQTVWLMKRSGLRWTEFGARVNMDCQLKHNQPGEPLSTIKIYEYPRNRNICPVYTLKAYVARTKPLRGRIDQIFITTTKPFRPVARNTISGWVKKMLSASGIDTTKYASHSTRAASTSAAIASGINVNTLMKQASWKCAQTFAVHYNKPIEDLQDSVTNTVASRYMDGKKKISSKSKG